MIEPFRAPLVTLGAAEIAITALRIARLVERDRRIGTRPRDAFSIAGATYAAPGLFNTSFARRPAPSNCARPAAARRPHCFDESMGVLFEVFVYYRVCGVVLDGIREFTIVQRNGWNLVPQSSRRRSSASKSG